MSNIPKMGHLTTTDKTHPQKKLQRLAAVLSELLDARDEIGAQRL